MNGITGYIFREEIELNTINVNVNDSSTISLAIELPYYMSDFIPIKYKHYEFDSNILYTVTYKDGSSADAYTGAVTSTFAYNLSMNTKSPLVYMCGYYDGEVIQECQQTE